MNKKIVGILIIVLFILSSVLTVFGKEININQDKEMITFLNALIVDQSQITTSFNQMAGIDPVEFAAQEFKPSMTPLVKVDIYCKLLSPVYPISLKISIKEDLKGEDLTYLELPSNQIPTSFDWVEFNFPDIAVIPEKTYYIVASTTSTMDGDILWKTTIGPTDYYERGKAWYSIDSGNTWQDHKESDNCFKTYTYGENLPPNTPTINGVSKGKINEYYNCTVYTTDPDGDDILYIVDWDEGTSNIRTIGPIPSAEIITISNKWNKKGSYTIKVKAQDINSAESDWATLDVTIPKSYIYNPLQGLITLLERFPFLERILNLI